MKSKRQFVFIFSQTAYNHHVVKAKIWPVAAKSKASKTTIELYEDALDSVLTQHKSIFALERSREQLLKARAQQQGEEGAAEDQDGSQKGKGKSKKAGKGSATQDKERAVLIKLRAKEKAGEPSSSESEEEEELPEELSDLEYLEIGLKHAMELDQRLRNRLEILYISLDEDWETARCAQELQQEDNSQSLKERAKKTVSDKRKAKKEAESFTGSKKRRFDKRQADYYGSRARFEKGRKPGSFGGGQSAGYGFEFGGHSDPYYERSFRKPRYAGPPADGYR
jgi:hypothetical protein